MQTRQIRPCAFIGVILFISLIAIIPVHAHIVTVPDGLSPGDPYRLAFVTSITTQALNPSLAFYQNRVNGVISPDSPLTDLGATWYPMVSTISDLLVMSNSHTMPGEPGEMDPPIYNLHGYKVVASYSDLWNTPIPTPLQAPIVVNEQGEPYGGAYVWTGFGPLGEPIAPLGNPFSGYGVMTTDPFAWAHVGNASAGQYLPIYALSSELTVPTPIPGAVWLLGSGLGALFVLRRKGRKA